VILAYRGWDEFGLGIVIFFNGSDLILIFSHKIKNKKITSRWLKIYIYILDELNLL
jgi:hypothetical protein